MASTSSASSSSEMAAAAQLAESSLFCNSCGISLDSTSSRGAHYRSEWHRYNLKRRCAGMGAIAERSFNEQLESLQQKQQLKKKLTSVRKCELCHSSFNNLSAFEIHLKSKKHLKRENYKKERTNSEKEQDENNEENNTEEKEEQQQEEENQTEEQSVETNSSSVSSSTTETTSTLSAALKQVRFADDTKADEKKVDGVEAEDETEGDDEEEFTGEPIPAGVCLFCPTDFGDKYDACLAHMLKRHGFFVPFLDQLMRGDVPGFLTYLGAKIGTGNFCIYCLSRFPDQLAVQQHMNAKNHCKIRLEDEEDEEEIMEFFNFDKDEKEKDNEKKETEQDGKENGNGRRPVSVNSMGELIMSDGSIIGTRDLKRYYKQNLRNAPPANEAIAALPAGTTSENVDGTTSAESSGESESAVQPVDSSKQQVVASYVHPRKLHGRALESKYLRKLQRVALRVGLSSNKQKHFRKSTP